MRTTIGAAGFTIVFNGKIDTRVGIPQLLVWQGAGKRQVGVADIDPCVCVCILQVVILGVSAMSQFIISTRKSKYILPQYLITQRLRNMQQRPCFNVITSIDQHGLLARLFQLSVGIE